MAEQPANPEVIERIRQRAFVSVTPGELGLTDEVVLPAYSSWDGKVHSLGGLKYRTRDKDGLECELRITHHGETIFLITLSALNYTKFQRGCGAKDLAKEVKFILDKR